MVARYLGVVEAVGSNPATQIKKPQYFHIAVFYFLNMIGATVIGAICQSIISVIHQPKPIYTAFLVINIASLVVNIVCFVCDLHKNKKQKNIFISKTRNL